jgi:cytoskeletal protein RodZ
MRLSRKKQEVDQKVVEPHQQSGWLVWLLSIVTFFLTVAIVLGLFWAGRWVVHRFTKKSTPTTPTISNTRSQTGGGSSAGNSGTTGNNGSGSTTTPPSSSSQSKPTPTTPPATNNTAPTTPPNLVNTGPDSDE